MMPLVPMMPMMPLVTATIDDWKNVVVTTGGREATAIRRSVLRGW